MTLLDQPAIERALAALDPAWTGDTTALRRSIEFADFPTAAEFVHRLVGPCEQRDHHPDVGLHWRRVDLELSTHSEGGVTAKDVDLAAALDEVAGGLPQA